MGFLHAGVVLPDGKSMSRDLLALLGALGGGVEPDSEGAWNGNGRRLTSTLDVFDCVRHWGDGCVRRADAMGLVLL
jgi:hypothetical protein